METARLEALLNEVASGNRSVPEALEALKTFPLDSALPFARLDTHRALRTGQPEVVLCRGKTPEQSAAIAERLAPTAPVILLTRADSETAEAVRQRLPQAIYHELSRCITIGEFPSPVPELPYAAVVSAGTADLPVAEEAVITLRCSGVPVRTAFDVGVAGLHRVLAIVPLLRNAGCVVVVAGMEGALASVVGGLVSCPVIACPTSVGYGASLGGVAALLTMLNSCASGVAVVNIDNGFGAGQLAARIVTAAGKRTHTDE
ncbi:MAG: nickel pincer cofactor biosynthesis protein LarB [Armatimonadaceae bacterium]